MSGRIRGRYGLLPNDPFMPRVTIRRRPGADLTPPPSADWYSAVPSTSWGMLGNGPDNSYAPGYQGCGDCTLASAGHVVDQVAFYSQGHKPSPVNSQEVVALYSELTGYDPRTGRNDTGATLQSALQIWAKLGLSGYKPSGYAQVDIRDQDLLRECIAYFGAIYVALNVPAGFEEMFDNGQPWDVPTNRRDQQIVGGHAIPIFGYDEDGWTGLTWSETIKITPAAFNRYFVEAWVVALPEMIEASGSTPSGLDVDAANAEFQELTGSTASPFAAVTPTPTPDPDPTPDPEPTPVPVVVPDGIGDVLLPMLQSVKDALDASNSALQAQAGALIAQAAATQQQSDVFGQAIADLTGGDTPPADVPPHVHGH